MSSFMTSNYVFKDFSEISDDEVLHIWELRNHPDIRKWMVHPEPIELPDHKNFIKSLSGRNDIQYYIVKDMTGQIIGSVNISFLSDYKVERGIYIDPRHQGKGHARRLLKEFYGYIHQRYSINYVITRVMKSNVSSNALEYSLGALQINSEDPKYNFYMLGL